MAVIIVLIICTTVMLCAGMKFVEGNEVKMLAELKLEERTSKLEKQVEELSKVQELRKRGNKNEFK